MKLAFFTNSASHFFPSRMPLVRAAQQKGFEVLVAVPNPRPSDFEICKNQKITLRRVPLSRGSLNPMPALVSISKLARVYREFRPDIVHHMTWQAIVLGQWAAIVARVPAVVTTFTGLGHLLISNASGIRVLRAILRGMFRLSLAMKPRTVLGFQNQDDLAVMWELGFIPPHVRTQVIPGLGVEIPKYSGPKPTKNPTPVVLYAGRLTREKGLVELRWASKQLWDQGLDFELWLAGELDRGSRVSLGQEFIESWSVESVGRLKILGHVDKMQDVLWSSDIVVLPSYREGMPRILVEAAAAGVARIATDVPGCRAAIQSGLTGVLVPVRDAPALAAGLEALLSDEALRSRLAQAGAKQAQDFFREEDLSRLQTAVYSQALEL